MIVYVCVYSFVDKCSLNEDVHCTYLQLYFSNETRSSSVFFLVFERWCCVALPLRHPSWCGPQFERQQVDEEPCKAKTHWSGVFSPCQCLCWCSCVTHKIAYWHRARGVGTGNNPTSVAVVGNTKLVVFDKCMFRTVTHNMRVLSFEDAHKRASPRTITFLMQK